MAVALFILAGLAEGVMWHLQFHYAPTGVFKNRSFWDPSISWKNKWKVSYDHGLETVHVGVERFFLSSRWLVWMTDGFHLMQFVRTISMTASLCVITGSILYGCILMVAFKSAFTAIFVSLQHESKG